MPTQNLARAYSRARQSMGALTARQTPLRWPPPPSLPLMQYGFSVRNSAPHPPIASSSTTYRQPFLSSPLSHPGLASNKTHSRPTCILRFSSPHGFISLRPPAPRVFSGLWGRKPKKPFSVHSTSKNLCPYNQVFTSFSLLVAPSHTLSFDQEHPCLVTRHPDAPSPTCTASFPPYTALLFREK